MARFYPSGGAGGGVGSDELTVTKDKVLQGSTYVGNDTNDEIGVGTMPNNGAVSPAALDAGGSYTIPAGYHNGSGKVTVQSLATLTASGDATAAQILTGKKAYVDGNLITGSMADQGAKTSSLNCGGSYTIPAGYHNGSGKITANSLASQTDATATAAYIRSGYTAWVKGSKLTGTMAVTSAINFSATAQSSSVIRISWTNPSKGPWEGVEIRMSTSSSPGVSGGTQAYKGKGNSTTAGGSNYVDISGLNIATTYYFTCTSYASGLGNGSSYNVNAKTSGTVIWNGSSVQNGASLSSTNYNKANLITYSFTQGSMASKKLMLTLKTNTSNACLDVSETYNNGSSNATFSIYVKSDGTVSSTLSGGYPGAAFSTWNAGTYTFSLSTFPQISTANKFVIGFWGNGDQIKFENYFSCVAII